MNSILLEDKYILNFINQTLNENGLALIKVNNFRYHHNTSYRLAPSILLHGILSLQELNNIGLTNYSDEYLMLMDDIESHVNGKDGISLSICGLKDLYKNEEEYNPFRSDSVDFLISDDVIAYRNSNRYGNEFIASKIISTDKIKSVDVRLINYINQFNYSSDFMLDDIIEKYNNLVLISETIENEHLTIPLREKSIGFDKNINTDKMSKSPKLILKKK